MISHDDDRKTILVLDDSEIILDVVRMELEAAGFKVLASANLDDFDAARQRARRVDLVLLDVQMPEMFGDSLGAVLKEELGLTCPVFLLSSLGPGELATRVTSAGIDGYVCKSDGMEALVQRVKEILVEPEGDTRPSQP